MNKKGEEFGVGSLIMVFIAVVVVVALITGGISNSIGLMTKTVDYVNQSTTAPATGSSINLNGQASSGVIVINGTWGTLVPSSNYTITNYVVSNGQLVTTLTAKAGLPTWQSASINVSYNSEPFGYATDSGSRAIIPLIMLFSALALAVVALVPTLRSGIVEMLGG